MRRIRVILLGSMLFTAATVVIIDPSISRVNARLLQNAEALAEDGPTVRCSNGPDECVRVLVDKEVEEGKTVHEVHIFYKPKQ